MLSFADLTLQAARDRAACVFADAGIEDAVADATALLCHAAGINRAGLIANGDALLAPERQPAFAACVERRLAREPVTRIVGKRGFWDIELHVAPDVLDPRADSETIVSTALEIFGARRSEPLRMLDLGCGSGAIVCALLDQFPEARGVAVDLSGPACALTRDNARLCKVMDRLLVEQKDWNSGLPSGHYDLIVSNPPYIRTGDIAGLDPEVHLHDPALALDGGEDGLNAYRSLAAVTAAHLDPAGWMLLEIGFDQSGDVGDILKAAGWHSIVAYRDLGGHIRVLAAQPPPDRL
ncbi:MAG: peptide chain release factor N(5)-glutamine methyltransferase [Hyphomicrobiales bacterium]|nr:peptide chain release factor N(5)-glutamine methyltransferase [Hyphomicrobiales bacterium]